MFRALFLMPVGPSRGFWISLRTMQVDYTNVVVPPLEGIDAGCPADFFPTERSEEGFGGKEGIRQAKPFSPVELARISDLIKQRLLEGAAAQSQEIADAFEKLPLERWHEMPLPYDHGQLLSKRNRIFSQAEADEIKRMSAFDYLREVFGDFRLTGEDNFGDGEINLRVVRPNMREDVGFLHADDWFWQYYGFKRPPGENRVKIWTLVAGDPATASLRLAPGSHLLNATCRAEKQGNKLIFETDTDWRTIGLCRYTGALGQPVLFNHRILHVGSLNPGPGCRVSFEATILFR